MPDVPRREHRVYVTRRLGCNRTRSHLPPLAGTSLESAIASVGNAGADARRLFTPTPEWPWSRWPARARALSRRGRRQAEAAARTGHEGEPRIERCELRPEELGERHAPGLIAGQARVAARRPPLPRSEVDYLRL